MSDGYVFRGGYIEDPAGDRWWSADLLKKVEAERDEARKAYMDLMAERNQIHAERDEARAAESYMERQLLAVKQECDELRNYAETVGLQAVTDASETYKVVVGERDIAEAELARVKKERDALRDALQWYVDHDDTNEGGRWEESNAGWLEGKRRAQALLAPGKKP